MRESITRNFNVIESPPHDSVWTMDKILAKPPQAPPRPPNLKGRRIRDFDRQYYDVRNQEENFENEEYGDRSHNDIDLVYRVILPSRKLFADDDEETELMSDVEDNIRDFADPPGIFDERYSTTQMVQPSLPLLPTLVPEENGNIMDNRKPIRRSLGPIVVEQDDDTSTSDDSVHYRDEFFTIRAHGNRDDQIFRRLGSTVYNAENRDFSRSPSFIQENQDSRRQSDNSMFQWLNDTRFDDIPIINTRQQQNTEHSF